MKTRMMLILGIGTVVIWGCGDKSTEPASPSKPSIFFSPDTVSVAKAERTTIQLNLKQMDKPVFGLTMRIQYVPILVSFNDAEDFTEGDYFKGENVSFVKTRSDSIYLTLSLTKGGSEVKGSGSLGTFRLIGLNKGTGEMVIVPSELHFYDSDGDTVRIPDMEIDNAIITVR